MTRRRWIVAAVALVAIAGLASAIALFFSDEPLRRYTEAKMNARLQGYTAIIGGLHFSPITFSLDLRDTVIVQHEHPDPPVANIGRLYAGVHWRAISGPLDKPNAGIIETIGGLVQNAFFKAILPGFEARLRRR